MCGGEPEHRYVSPALLGPPPLPLRGPLYLRLADTRPINTLGYNTLGYGVECVKWQTVTMHCDCLQLSSTVITETRREIETVFSSRTVQFLFCPLSFRQVVASVSILDRGNWDNIKSRQKANKGSDSVFYSLV